MESESMVAACDRDILGKTFSEGELTIHVSKEFYKGEPATEAEVIAALQKATIANLLGKRAVSCGTKSGVIDQDHVITIGGVQHAQLVRMR
ncbi:MAG TPA: DUF424 domain-containing protein [Methanocellales archaeon]|nr:DUF424 domain-containing protein [Methanocellales archaeon]